MGGSWSKNSWFQGNSTSTINNDQSSGGTRFQHKVKVDLKDLRKPQFVFTRKGSMFFDEDGDLAHEFYEEIRTQNSQVTYMKKRDCNLRPQGTVYYDTPRLHMDFPIVMYSPLDK